MVNERRADHMMESQDWGGDESDESVEGLNPLIEVRDVVVVRGATQ